MVTIELNNAISQLTLDGIHNTTEIYREISDHLSYEMEGAEFTGRRGWDGRIRLLKSGGRFPTGLLRRLVRFLRKKKIEYKLKDCRIPAPTHKLKIELAKVFRGKPFEPRDYQFEACDLTDKISRGVYLVGTGGGKTIMAGMIVQKRKVPTLFITPDTGLREQTYDVFADLLGEEFVTTNINGPEPIVVANIQYLINQKPESFKRFGMLMIDEFHHGAAKSYLNVNKMCDFAYYRYGMTGTFTRPDGEDMKMHGVLSDIIFKKTTSELIELGWLVRPYITITRHKVKGWSRLSYKDAYNAIIADPGFNEMVAKIANQKIEEGKQTLVLVRRKDHGELLNRLIEDSVYISGDDPLEYRDKVVKDFIKKKVPCIIATNIFGEGKDIPSIEVLINARCQKTEIQTLQGIGRALRKIDGKDKAEIFDFLIIGQKHLTRHSVERINSYRHEPAFRIKVIR